MSINKKYDVVIVGGGPAGATAALYANRLGLEAILIDKSIWPRDKICGDALSGKVVDMLKDLDILSDIKLLDGSTINRIVFGSPKNKTFEIDLSKSLNDRHIREGYVIPRKTFDYFLFNKAKKVVDVLEGFNVKEVLMNGKSVIGIKGHNQNGESNEILSSVVLGCDGFNSVIAKKLNLYAMNMKHTALGIRCYFEGVKGLSDQIELHFIKEINPGYFWLFPAGDGLANIGLGLSKRYIKNDKKDLVQLLDIVTKLDYFKDRFKNAKPLEKPRGWNLPMGSIHRKNHGDGFMLLGDAAGLIDPFTGEGIGNAMISAKYAIATLKKAVNSKDFSEKSLSAYDKLLWENIGPELKISTNLQKLARSRFLLNFVINKASRNENLKDVIGGMLANEVARGDLTNPLFYYKILFS